MVSTISLDLPHGADSNDIKKTWDGIRSIINTKEKNLNNITQLKVNEEVINNPKKIVEEINNFFVNVGPITEQTIPRNPVVNPVKYLKNRNQFNFLVTNLSNEEVLNIIKNLEDKSTGPQSIPIKLLKLIPDLILVPCTQYVILLWKVSRSTKNM